ncbi:MAG: SHOCT domain-containing protein [Solirubrobacterales bacterium]
MDCYCGRGARVPRDRIDANLRLTEVALELLAWDKQRSTQPLEPADLVETDRLIDRGMMCHRRLLAVVHGEREDPTLAESESWLQESRARWRDRPGMVEKGGMLKGPKLRLTEEDFARLDRARPDLSFSGDASPPATPAAGDEDADVVTKLERLAALRTDGLLTEEEFQAAKARVIG